jgi:small nuclear ribonucleoprotein (snRNP)-like protein
MGKRQIVYKAGQIGGNNDLIDKEVNLITTEDRVWHGRIVSVNQSEVVLKDARSGKHTFPLDQIDKIYRDIVTDY